MKKILACKYQFMEKIKIHVLPTGEVRVSLA